MPEKVDWEYWVQSGEEGDKVFKVLKDDNGLKEALLAYYIK